MKFSTVAIAAVAATAVAAPQPLTVRANELQISGSNAAQLAKDYAPVYTLAPGAFATTDPQPMGFLDFSGYVNFLVGLLQYGGQFIKDGGNALVNLDINKVGAATVNFFQGLMQYFNAFLAAVKIGTKFDKAVYEFLINSGVADFLTKVSAWIINLSNLILRSPLLQGVIDVLKPFIKMILTTKQAVQQNLGSAANTVGFDRALLAANSVQAAAQKKVSGN